VLESFLQVQQEIEQAGLIPEFIQYLQKIRSPHVIDSENTSDIPQFFNTVTMKYPKWFGLHISTPQQCIGYFVLALSASQEYSREDIHFFLTLFSQIAGHIRHLITHETEINDLRKRVVERTSHGKIIGQSEEMQRIYELIDLVSTSDATVLITGENGTGKELVAQAIHRQSHRKDSAFVVANCSAYSPALLESELFGHEKGAFTDAKTRKEGLLEVADGGALFLNEIGHMEVALQAKLLSVIEHKAFRRVGGKEEISVDVRIIAATNGDLKAEVEEGVFREDLYYRLHVFPIFIPPLRERKEDIMLLAHFFLEQFNKEFGKEIRGFSEDASDYMVNYDWPGNIRELKNAVERATILGNADMITPELLFPEICGQETTDAIYKLPEEGIALEEVERRLIKQALDMAGWNQISAAKLLRLGRGALQYRMKKYGFLK